MSCVTGNGDGDNILSILSMASGAYRSRHYDKAAEYWLLAVDRYNSCEAMMCLAEYYEEVVGNAELVVKYLQMAVDQGDIIAMYKLANYYDLKTHEVDLAIKYYTMAVDKDKDVPSMINLGNKYYQSKKDVNTATKYYQMAIDAGSIAAWSCMGTVCNSVSNTGKRDVDYVISCYQRVINNKHMLGDDNSEAYSISLHNLGIIYQDNKDYNAAISYYMLAVNDNFEKSIPSVFSLLNLVTDKSTYVTQLVELLQSNTCKVKSHLSTSLIAYINSMHH